MDSLFDAEPTQARDQELAAALWCVVSPRLEDCSAQLVDLEARLRAGGAHSPSAADLAVARAQTETLGWLVGCVAEGLDSRLFSERRSTQGAQWLLELLEQACRLQDRVLAVSVDAQSPEGTLSLGEMWACAEVLWVASRCASAALEGRLEWTELGWRLACRGRLAEAVNERAQRWSGQPALAGVGEWTWAVSCSSLPGERL